MVFKTFNIGILLYIVFLVLVQKHRLRAPVRAASSINNSCLEETFRKYHMLTIEKERKKDIPRTTKASITLYRFVYPNDSHAKMNRRENQIFQLKLMVAVRRSENVLSRKYISIKINSRVNI